MTLGAERACLLLTVAAPRRRSGSGAGAAGRRGRRRAMREPVGARPGACERERSWQRSPRSPGARRRAARTRALLACAPRSGVGGACRRAPARAPWAPGRRAGPRRGAGGRGGGRGGAGGARGHAGGRAPRAQGVRAAGAGRHHGRADRRACDLPRFRPPRKAPACLCPCCSGVWRGRQLALAHAESMSQGHGLVPKKRPPAARAHARGTTASMRRPPLAFCKRALQAHRRAGAQAAARPQAWPRRPAR